jgi:hypothetical protein
MTYAPFYLAVISILVVGIPAGVHVAVALMRAEREGGER